MPIPRQKIAKRLEFSVRAVTREDLPRLLPNRDKSEWMPKRLRDSHHTVARLLATGISNRQVAALTGYSEGRVGMLAQSPAMRALVADYRDRVDEIWEASVDTYSRLAVGNMLAAERHIADRIADLEDDGELLPVRDALAISRDAADRFGYGKKQTNLNVNADFAALLEKAISKSGKTIEGSGDSPTVVPFPRSEAAGILPNTQPPSIRRRL